MGTSSRFLPEPGLSLLIDEFAADLAVLGRRYRLTRSERRIERIGRLLHDWRSRVDLLPFEELDRAGKIDYVLFKNHLAKLEHGLGRDLAESGRLFEVVPFSATVVALDEAREAMTPVDPAQAAETLDELAKAIAGAEPIVGDAPALAWAEELKKAMEDWTAHYTGYDPAIAWWVREPIARVNEGLGKYIEGARRAAKEAATIPGRAMGRDEIVKDLAFEMIPYTPEELIAIGDREYAWCLSEMLKAARELGFGDDWKAALEYVKNTFVPPGEQPGMVRGLALEAIEYVESRDLLTVPDLAKETWRMEMMSPEAQKTNPFFLGGESIIVSYPTDAMTYEEKRMSMRGNNPNFSRATVQHELIPGHHLQMYMTERFRRYRQLFSTPFWIEGWTLYWELLLWELGFPRTPEERIGMLFWRMHRCVRISFSLRFHLGELSTADCVEILVDRVGHERANAEGEVRRSFNGLYPPLYQAAYMIGGLQVRALKRELVDSGQMTFRQFHDAIMAENEMPPAMLRLVLRGEDPNPEEPPLWRFDA